MSISQKLYLKSLLGKVKTVIVTCTEIQLRETTSTNPPRLMNTNSAIRPKTVHFFRSDSKKHVKTQSAELGQISPTYELLTRQILFERICTTFIHRAITADELKRELENLLPDISNNRKQKFIFTLMDNMELPYELRNDFLENEWGNFQKEISEKRKNQ